VKQKRQAGMTLVELIVAIAIMAILATGVLPISRTVVKREREKELRAALWQMRDAIDRYKDYADRGAFQIKLGSEGYPPDMDTLVKGVDINGKKIRFLRHVPMDPMTHSTEWGMRSMQDDPASNRGAGNRCSTFTQNRTAPGWMARSMRTGKATRMTLKRRKMGRKSAGFTMIELIIVIAIIMILASVAAMNYQHSVWRAREAVLRNDLFTLRSSIDQYTLDKQKGATIAAGSGGGGLHQDHAQGSDHDFSRHLGHGAGRLADGDRPDGAGNRGCAQRQQCDFVRWQRL